MEYGTVILGNYTLCSCKEENPPQAILGRATEEDAVRAAAYKSKEREALLFCRKKAEALGLDMKIISVVFSLRDDKVLFFFSADTRVDFRTLVKELGAQYQRRIELRQIGARDETRLLGGMGNCGRPLCCHAYLSEFMPVSIKMAKEQGLALNPQKISGACGRLMCCLKHETDTYAELNKTLPRKGDSVQLSDGVRGDVVEVSVLKQMLRVACYVNGEKSSGMSQSRKRPSSSERKKVCRRRRSVPRMRSARRRPEKPRPSSVRERKDPESGAVPRSRNEPGRRKSDSVKDRGAH